MISLMKHLAQDETGVTAIEYGLIAAGIGCCNSHRGQHGRRFAGHYIHDRFERPHDGGQVAGSQWTPSRPVR